MRPKLVMCSAASLVLTAVVMAESFTKVTGCERSVSESWATTTAAGASNVPKSTQLIANVDFMFVPQFVNSADCAAHRQDSQFAIARSAKQSTWTPGRCVRRCQEETKGSGRTCRSLAEYRRRKGSRRIGQCSGQNGTFSQETAGDSASAGDRSLF